MIVARTLFFALMLAAPAAGAASFDCTKAASQMEKLICGDPALSALDEKLAQSYARALARVGDRKLVRQFQRDWLGSHAVATCHDAACLADVFEQRVAVLDAAVASPWNGRYERMDGKKTDVNSAEVTLMGMRDGQAVVTGSAIRIGLGGLAGAVNTGEISGVASIEGKALVYYGEECWVRIARGKDGLQLTDNGSCGGHNVTFTGRYVLTGR